MSSSSNSIPYFSSLHAVSSPSPSPSSSSTPLFSNSGMETKTNTFLNLSWPMWIFIIILLALLGFNIFTYLAKGTQDVASLLAPLTKWVLELFGNTVKETVDVSSTGAKATIDVATNSVKDTINTVAGNGTQPSSYSNKSTVSSTPFPAQPDTSYTQEQDALQASLSNEQQQQQQQQPSSTVEADDSYSTIQMSKTSGKSGWCYIGEDRGFRSCIQVGPNDQCMSGDIFPSNDVCMNPNLRV